LLIPGLGQWLQSRVGEGLLLFVLWLLVAGQFAWVAHAAWVPTAEVGSSLIVVTGLLALAVNLAAAGDAWQLRTVG
jgi:hypothetical protein